MPNALYEKLFTTVTSYIDQDAAEGTLGRQLKRCDATPDTVTAEQLQGIMKWLIAGATLPLHPDKAKQSELTEKLKALV